GRVQIDADWNEQGGILLHIIRQIAADEFGPAAASTRNGGFTVVPLKLDGGPVPNDFGMTPGNYYVDGILCGLDGKPLPLTAVDTTANTASVANWTVDATPFVANQFVRVWNDTANPGTQPPAPIPVTNMPPLAVSQVKQADYANLKLTLDSLPSGLA